MKQMLVLLTLLLIQGPTSAQTSSGYSAREVLQRFCEMEVAGKGLSPEAWKEMAVFLLHPVAQSQRKLIVVKDFVVSEPLVQNDRAEFYVEYVYLGQLDSSLARYSRLPSTLPPSPVKVRVEYYLVRDNAQKDKSSPL